MSATEAARQKLDGLRKQQSSYREKLHQQEAELRRLQNEVYQNRTVVEVTMPGEINKAYEEYLETLKISPHQHQSQSRKEAHDALLLEEQDLAAALSSYHHHSSLFFFSSYSSSSSRYSSSPTCSPGSLLSLLTFTTTILLALWDTILGALADKILAQLFVVLSFFFPALRAHAATQRRRQQQQQHLQQSGGWSRRSEGVGGAPALCVGGEYYGGSLGRGRTRFTPIHM